MQKIILITLIMLVTMLTKLTAQEVEYPLDWSYRQDVTESYEIGPDKTPEFSNQNILTIKSVKSKINGFGNSMKTIKSDSYLGKTVKMTGYVKSKNVKSWAGLWMRVDYYTVDVLAFDNMRNRGIKRTTDWTKYEVVLFVPAEATSISYGVLLNGTGQIWFKDVKLEVIDDAVPETGMNQGRKHKVVSFEKRAKAIAEQIKTIKDSQKNALKTEIEALDKEVAKGIISKEKAEELKLKKAEECAANIDAKVAIEEGKLSQLIQDKVDGKLEEENTDKNRGTSIVVGGGNDSIGKDQTEINITSLKVYQGEKDKEDRKSKRTTSQMVFAAGLNNLVTDGKVQDSDYKFMGSHFYEWGVTYNTRIAKNNNLLHAKYGLSVMYNNLRPTDNRSFVVDGDQTNLGVNPIDLKDSRFRNVYLVAPVYLEFDFSGKKIKEDKTFFKTHQSFRFGIGGYAGINLKSKQILKYEENDHKTTERVRGDFNTSNFIYGLSTYIGYKETSLYLKYDLNPLFTDNAVKQNNVSLGLRFDFN
jgi:ribosomal protein S20